MKKLFFSLLVVAGGVLVVFLVVRSVSSQGFLGEVSGSYKAVTLANGTTYFGKITKADGSIVILSDVFYLRLTQPADAKDKAAQQGFELVKLGANEIYGPQDEILLNRRQILSTQELKPDSKVIAAISEYYSAKKATPTPAKSGGKVDVRGQ